ncbi:sodium:melibiose symporter [Lactiplantibacillus fabifermentans T30PCM01]|uniref:Sodium:melibiose symporter n=1 Tax=Lactiplantibacillus fabifermentans T30PCM01 TaxID=1400520 RepID=W6TBM0_9LACO|nr:glycoside-pentoside-hexuronide (GPH):cation symporter [Lactiplantibacillus fabifermentans]ETY72875.1 sodium:melibiose symporter [Lactiplantibacillus fabifermentans T30PCM01]
MEIHLGKHSTSDNSGEMGALSMRERISYGAGGMGNAIVNAVVTGFLMFFYTDQLHVNGGIVGTIFLISKVLDGVSDLIMGYAVDQTKSKYGKARPWILWIMLPYAVSGVLLFLLQDTWPSTLQYVYIFVTYTLTSTVFFTAICTPYNAMNALITKNQYERGLLGSTNVIGNLLAQILVNTFMLRLVTSFGNTQSAWIWSTAIFAVVGLAAHYICFSQTMERSSQVEKEASPKFSVSIKSLFHNKYWIMVTLAATLLFFMNTLQLTAAVYFAKGIIHNTNAVAGLTNSMNVGQMIIILFAFVYIKKLGKARSFKYGYVLVTLTYIAQVFVGGSYSLLITLGFIRGLGMGMASACMAGLISDTIEYGEWKTGVRTVGMSNAANSFSQKIGNGIGTAMVGWLTAAAGYSASATVQNSSSIAALNTLFTYVPLVCAALVVVLMWRFDLDKFYDKIVADLDQRHATKISK